MSASCLPNNRTALSRRLWLDPGAPWFRRERASPMFPKSRHGGEVTVGARHPVGYSEMDALSERQQACLSSDVTCSDIQQGHVAAVSVDEYEPVKPGHGHRAADVAAHTEQRVGRK